MCACAVRAQWHTRTHANFRTFVVENKNEEVMSEEVIIKYNTPTARDAAIRGMLNAKKEWLSYVQQLPSK